MGYGAWVGGKRPSHHPGWVWVGVWLLWLEFEAGRGPVLTSELAASYWPEAFATYRHNIGHDRHNLNACQHKWRELWPKLDHFKAYYEAVSSCELSHEDRVAVANIEFRGKKRKAFDKIALF
ncbi:hypothetical protein Hanom_Chr11g00988531 [Helianthus anomalus]